MNKKLKFTLLGAIVLGAFLAKDNVKSLAATNAYENGIFYDENKKPANWWYDDGEAWYFFKNGKKLTGEGIDSNGKHQFKNGKYLQGYLNNLFYADGNLANWWYDDGNAWYYFKDGKKLTGYAVDGNGKRYFVNGKYANGVYKGNLYKDGVDITANNYVNGIFYDENKRPANWWYDDGEAWYFFKYGKKLTGEGTDANGKHQFKNGKYLQGYKNNVFYQDGNPCNWWADDGYAWYFFKGGKKLTGEAVDGNGKRYFVNGKYANGVYKGNLYKDGVDASCNSYVNGIFYDENKKPANWWYDDGEAWYFFKDGKKLTGEGTDANGKHQFKNGKYLTGYANNLFYEDGNLANWWHDDGNDWYYFKDGKKLTGEGTDANGDHYFVNGKYATSNSKYHTRRYELMVENGLTDKEAELAERINEYRRQLGLREFSVSKSLTKVARTHVIDSNKYHPEKQYDSRGIKGNLHSWSNHGNWTPVVYTPDHKYAKYMWSKPAEISEYKDDGFEIAYINTYNLTAKSALDGWKGSKLHNDVIIGTGFWSNLKVMGVGIDGDYSFVWFGVSENDPAGFYLSLIHI